MKKLTLWILSAAVFTLLGCTAPEIGYNTAAYFVNEECERAKNCSGGIDGTYQENEKARAVNTKILSDADKNEQLEKLQKELDENSD